MSWIDKYLRKNPKRRKAVNQEGLLLEFSEMVCEKMEEYNWETKGLAKKIGITERKLRYMLNGSNITIREMADIATALGCDIKMTLKEGK